jgi:hypothetical protein
MFSSSTDCFVYRIRFVARRGASLSFCRLSAHPDRSAKEFRERVEALNRKILAFNLKAPAASVHRQRFRP